MGMNPLQQLFGGMGNGGNGMGGMNQNMMWGMLQQVMSGKMNPQQALGQMGGQIQNMSIDEYNKQVLGMATQFNNMYGNKEGSITNVLLNSGLTVNQLNQAIQQFKSSNGIK